VKLLILEKIFETVNFYVNHPTRCRPLSPDAGSTPDCDVVLIINKVKAASFSLCINKALAIFVWV
jgi:hypothetical protein